MNPRAISGSNRRFVEAKDQDRKMAAASGTLSATEALSGEKVRCKRLYQSRNDISRMGLRSEPSPDSPTMPRMSAHLSETGLRTPGSRPEHSPNSNTLDNRID
jgi:hypothetical protein